MKRLTKEMRIEVLFFAFVLGIWLLWAFILPLEKCTLKDLEYGAVGDVLVWELA